MTDFFPQDPPTADVNGSNEYEGHPDEQTYVDSFPKPGHTLLNLGHPLDRVAAADKYAAQQRRGERY